jgi:hypothetical protein
VLRGFSLLFKLPEVQDLRLAEFCKILIQLYDCLRPLSDQVVVQWTSAHCFYALSNYLIIRHLRSLGFQLHEPPVEIW